LAVLPFGYVFIFAARRSDLHVGIDLALSSGFLIDERVAAVHKSVISDSAFNPVISATLMMRLADRLRNAPINVRIFSNLPSALVSGTFGIATGRQTIHGR
jgi:hypothetical protein